MDVHRLKIGCEKKALEPERSIWILAMKWLLISVHDLNGRPWPFASEAFLEIHVYDVLEHLDDVTLTLEEANRVGRLAQSCT